MGRFLEERTVSEPGARVKASELYGAYKNWCEEGGEAPVTGTAFGRSMSDKGFKKSKAGCNYYEDIKLGG